MVKVMETCILVTLLLFLVAFHGNATQSALSQSPVVGPAPAGDCSTLIYNMMDCLTFLSNGGNETKPDASCCSGFKSVVEANDECICYALSSSVSLGLDINMTNAESLPSACKVPAPPISACNIGESPVPSPANPPARAPSEPITAPPTTQPPATAPVSGGAPSSANSAPAAAASHSPAPSPHKSGSYTIAHPTFEFAFGVVLFLSLFNVLALA